MLGRKTEGKAGKEKRERLDEDVEKKQRRKFRKTCESVT